MTTAIVGIGRTEFTRSSGRTPLAMAAEACRAALSDAGMDAAEVDGVGCFQYNDSAMPIDVAWALGRDEIAWASAPLGGGDLAAQIITNAAAMVECGACQAVLVYRSLNGRSGLRFGTMTEGFSVGGANQFDAPAGFLVPPQFLAAWARRYQSEYQSTSEDLGEVAITQRRHAQLNPNAAMREPLTMDAYLASRWICEPFRVNDCAFEVDGAVALLITSAERAADAATKPVFIHGCASSAAGSGWLGWDDMTSMYSRDAAPRLWSRTGLQPRDIDVALMYDCFTYTVLATTEDYGFCAKGEAGDFYREGRATFGGDVVINPHGGLLSEGYLHGLNHHYEAALQLRGDAGERQVPDARLALATAGAGPYGGAIIYSSEQE
ncbi:MAG: nonspecific lipid-transfer protein [Actinomycetota bacterium]|nr:nonspecific lipid-transfer protein [Actinomycetota bacterium]